MAQREMGKDTSQFVPIKYGSGMDSDQFPIVNALIGSLFLLMLLRLYRSTHGKGKGGSSGSSKGKSGGSGFGGGMGGMNDLMNMSKSGATVYGVEKKIRTRFKHVAGLSNAKQE